MIKLSIIIPSWNTVPLLRNCLGSVVSNFHPPAGGPITNYEVIVVDNGSEDGSVEMVKKEFPGVNLIINKENIGFGKANNQAAKIARGEYLFFLNSDTLVRKFALEKLINFLEENPKTGAVSPLLLNEDDSYQLDPCYLKFPSPLRTFVYYNKYLRKIVFKIFPSLLLSLSNFSSPSEVDQLPGAAFMIRKKSFDKIGGFDESFPIYFEDVDLSFQIKKNGDELFVIPDSKIVHLGRRSIKPVIEKEGFEKFLLLNFHSLFLFCKKNYSENKTRLIKLAVFVNLLLGFKFRLIKRLI